MKFQIVMVVALFLGCAGETPLSPAGSEDGPVPGTQVVEPVAVDTIPVAEGRLVPREIGPLELRWIGVQGFLLTYGGESVLTAPLFTRPNGFTVSTGLPVTSDTASVSSHLSAELLSHVSVVLAGHAHYDHLLDVPAVLQRAPNATLYSNISARNLLAAWAPDRQARCIGTDAQSPTISRSRVIALDDPLASHVDWTNCPSKKPAQAPLQGSWVKAGEHVRILAVCSEHPDQIGPYHFGAGDVTDEACEPPTSMPEWKEGVTLAFLIDFLDPYTDAPLYRVYYQDAPATAPLGQVPPMFLADKRVDVALLNVGSYENAPGEPGNILQELNPRFAIGGHWEDFFRGADAEPQPIPLLDPDGWKQKALTAIGNDAAGSWLTNGAANPVRVVVPHPGDTFSVPH
ncbi:MAG: MBL fold metallo-hydrolase [Myxococcaceae bacterium]